METKLKRRRISAGYTQSELSEASGVNIKSLTNYEQDPKKLNSASVSSIIKLADCLGCHVEDLVDRSVM